MVRTADCESDAMLTDPDATTSADSEGYGFACTSCGAEILVVPGSSPDPPYQTTVTVIRCRKCGESHAYAGQMIRLPLDRPSPDEG